MKNVNRQAGYVSECSVSGEFTDWTKNRSVTSVRLEPRLCFDLMSDNVNRHEILLPAQVLTVKVFMSSSFRFLFVNLFK